MNVEFSNSLVGNINENSNSGIVSIGSPLSRKDKAKNQIRGKIKTNKSSIQNNINKGKIPQPAVSNSQDQFSRINESKNRPLTGGINKNGQSGRTVISNNIHNNQISQQSNGSRNGTMKFNMKHISANNQ